MMQRAAARHFAAWAMGLAFAGFSLGADYHVAVTGNDTNPGTVEKPFKTIQRGAEVAQPGDTVLVAPGRYNELVTPPRSGEPGKPITFRSSEKGKAAVYASIALTGFTKVPGLKHVYSRAQAVNDCYGLVDETTLYLYTLLPTPETCDLVPASFCLDRARGRLYVHTSDSTDPAGHQLELSVQPGVFYVGKWRSNTPKHDIIIEGFTIKGSWRGAGAGVVFAHGSLRGIVRNCRFEFCSRGIAAALDADDTVAENCDITRCLDGINFSYLRRGRVVNNRIVRRDDHFPLNASRPTVGVYFYCWYRDGDNMSWIENNYIEGFGDGIRLKDPAVAVCRNNTIVRCDSGIGSHPGVRREFVNNLLVDCTIPIEWFQPGNFPPVFVTDYNCAYNEADPASAERWLAAYRAMTKQEQHGFVAFPRILGRDLEPMALAPNSPCVGKGEKGANIGSLPVAPAAAKDTRPPIGTVQCVAAAGAAWKPPSSSLDQRDDMTLAQPWQRAQEAMTAHRLVKSEAVTLKLSAWDVEGPVTAMQFSNDGRDWSAPVAYAAQQTWKLTPGDGKKTICARFKDNAENWSEPATTEVWLKTKPPALIGGVDARTNASGICISWHPSEPCEGILHYGATEACGKTRRAFLYVDGPDESPSAQHVVFLAPPEISRANFVFYKVELRDMAGNSWTSPVANVRLAGDPKEFFVSGAAGSDENAGTQDQPWKTLSRATRSALPGDVVTVRAGVYYEPLAATCGGASEASHITYRADGNVVIERAGHYPYGVVVQGLKFLTVEGFEVRGFSQSGIAVLDSSDIALRRNNVHPGYIERLTDQAPSTGQYGISIKNSQRVNVEHCLSYWSTCNLFLQSTSGCHVEHCTLADSGVYSQICMWNDNPDTRITNTILVGPANVELSVSSDHFPWFSDYNCWEEQIAQDKGHGQMVVWDRKTPTGEVSDAAPTLADWQKESKMDLHSISGGADPKAPKYQPDFPKFVNRDKGDFHLKPDSPCVKAGQNGTDIGALGVAK